MSIRSHRRGRTPRTAVTAWWRAIVVAVGAVVVATSLGITPPQPPTAQAAAGVTEAPTVVFTENFENGMTNLATGAKSYTTANGAAQYVGAAGQTYTGSTSWINGNRCNGVILSYNNSLAPAWASTPVLTNKCSTVAGVQSYNGIRTLARAMGVVTGSGDNEHIVSGYTECQLTALGNTGTCDVIGSGPTNGVMFQTTTSIPVTPNRYYTFSVDTVYGNCANPASTTTQASDPQYQFQLVDGGGLATNVGGVLNGCRPSPTRQTVVVNRPLAVGTNTTMTAYVQSLQATSAFQYAGSSLGIKMYNASGVTNGNDGGFDNIRLLDVTPSLDKSFSPTVVTRGGVSKLTFTITNTTDLLAKSDWTFTDALPTGLVIAPTPNIGGTCAQVTGNALVRTAVAGGTSIAVTGGDLALGQASCTITVDVTSNTDGTYVNGPANVTTNLNPPENASVEFIKPSIDLVKTSNIANYDSVGDIATYTFVATNTTPKALTNTVANTSLTNVTITEDSFSGVGDMSTLVCDKPAPVTLASGAKLTCTATYVVQQSDLDNAPLTNVARTTGTPATGPNVTDTDDEIIPAVWTPALLLDKTVSIVDVDQDGVTGLGDHLLYAFDVTNTGNVTVAGIAVVDDRLTQRSITVTCTPTTIVPAQIARCVANAPYVLTQADVDAGEVVNTAHSTGTDPDGGPVRSNDDSTTTPVEAFRIPLQIEKIGESSDDTWVRMDGSSFAILEDVNGEPGTALPFTLDDVETGLFQIDGIPAGTYWLSELAAPDGFTLLAAPVQFVINADRTVSITAGGDEAVTATGQLITVRDVPAMLLPTTGGAGPLPYLLAGSLVVLIAGGLALRVRRRNAHAETHDPQA